MRTQNLINNLYKENIIFSADSAGITCGQKKGPRTKPNKLERGLCGGLINSETRSNHTRWSEMKTF